MGNRQSTASSISTAVNNAVSNVMLSSSNNCGQNNNAVQTLTFSNIKALPGCSLNFSNITQESYQAPNFSCVSSSNQSSSFQTALQAALQQAVNAETSGISGALNSATNSSAMSSIVNNIKNSINISSTASCIQNSLSTQEQIYNKLGSSCPAVCNNPNPTADQITLLKTPGYCDVKFNNIRQTLTQTATANCLSENSALATAIDKASSEVSQIAASADTGFDPLKDLEGIFGGAENTYIAASVVLLCCIILPCILSIISSMTSGGSELSSAAASQIKNYPATNLQ